MARRPGGVYVPDHKLWVPDHAEDAIRIGRSLVSAEHGNPLLLEVLDKEQRPKTLAIFPQGGGFPPHVLIVGSTRGGKTSGLRYWIIGVVRRNAKLVNAGREDEVSVLWLADGKYSEAFLCFDEQPGVVKVLGNKDDGPKIATMIADFREIVEDRYSKLSEFKHEAKRKGRRGPWTPFAPMYLILDEFLNWSLSLTEDERDTAIKHLMRIGAIGGEVNMRLWIATQRPDSARTVEAGLPGNLKSLLMCRIAQVGLVGMHELEARMAFDDSKAVERLTNYAKRAKLTDWRGLGMIQQGQFEVPYKTNWAADPLNPETSEEDAIKTWKMLPYHPPEVEAWLQEVAA